MNPADGPVTWLYGIVPFEVLEARRLQRLKPLIREAVRAGVAAEREAQHRKRVEDGRKGGHAKEGAPHNADESALIHDYVCAELDRADGWDRKSIDRIRDLLRRARVWSGRDGERTQISERIKKAKQREVARRQAVATPK